MPDNLHDSGAGDVVGWRATMEAKVAVMAERIKNHDDRYARKEEVTKLAVKMWLVIGVLSFLGATVGKMVLDKAFEGKRRVQSTNHRTR